MQKEREAVVGKLGKGEDMYVADQLEVVNCHLNEILA